VQIDAPAALKTSSHPSLQHAFSVVQQQFEIEGKHEDRPLHAKSLWLERDGRALYMLGSSNFTATGLGLHPRHNIELNIAYVIRDCGSRFGKLCAQSWPQETELDELKKVQFLGGSTEKVPRPDLYARACGRWWRNSHMPRKTMESRPDGKAAEMPPARRRLIRGP
jgi:hypothetical protein